MAESDYEMILRSTRERLEELERQRQWLLNIIQYVERQIEPTRATGDGERMECPAGAHGEQNPECVCIVRDERRTA